MFKQWSDCQQLHHYQYNLAGAWLLVTLRMAYKDMFEKTEGTIQRHWAQDTERAQTKAKNTTQKPKDPTKKPGVNPGVHKAMC